MFVLMQLSCDVSSEKFAVGGGSEQSTGVCVCADDKTWELRLLGAQDAGCCRILPKIGETSALNVPACDAAVTDDIASVLPVVTCALFCHECGPGSDRCANAAADSLPEEKSLPPMCDANVTVADIHVGDSDKLLSSLHDTHLDSLHDTDLDSDSCSTPARVCVQPHQQKLLPLSDDDVGGDTIADIFPADCSFQAKLLPFLSDTGLTSNDTDLTNSCDSQRLQKMLPSSDDDSATDINSADCSPQASLLPSA